MASKLKTPKTIPLWFYTWKAPEDKVTKAWGIAERALAEDARETAISSGCAVSTLELGVFLAPTKRRRKSK
jgi:hypothetical protein